MQSCPCDIYCVYIYIYEHGLYSSIHIFYIKTFLFGFVRYHSERGDAVAKASKQGHVVSI